MARLTDTNMTPAERAAFGRLQKALGFSPKVLFGRDGGGNPILHRLIDRGTAVVYALAVEGHGTAKHNDVREFRFLVAPVGKAHMNGHREATAEPRRKRPRVRDRKAWREHIRAAVKASWAKRHAEMAAAAKAAQ